MDVRVELLRKLSAEESMHLNFMLDKTFDSLLDYKDIQPVIPKGNQSWIFIGRTDAVAETLILGHLMRRTDSFERPWFWERLRAGGEGATEDEMIGWHHWLNGHEFEQALGVDDGQGGLAYCSLGVTESNTTERLNWTDSSSTKYRCLFHNEDDWMGKSM